MNIDHKKTIAKQIFKTSYITGSFKLRSGEISNEYFDKYQFEADPDLLRKIASLLSKKLPKNTEILAGLEMGGIPISTALSLQTELPQVLVRKEPKKYGTKKLAEGPDVSGKKLTIIEDVVTTGGQVISSANQLKELGADVRHALCVIRRGREAKQNLSENGICLISLFTDEELENYK